MTFKKGDFVRAKPGMHTSRFTEHTVEEGRVYEVTRATDISVSLKDGPSGNSPERFELVGPNEEVIGYTYQYLSQRTGNWERDTGVYDTEAEALNNFVNAYSDGYQCRVVRLTANPQVFEIQPRTIKALA